MSPTHIGLAVSILVLIVQGVNVYLFLRIRVAILDSEKRTERWVDDEFVRTKTCDAIHNHGPRARSAKPTESYP